MICLYDFITLHKLIQNKLVTDFIFHIWFCQIHYYYYYWSLTRYNTFQTRSKEWSSVRAVIWTKWSHEVSQGDWWYCQRVSHKHTLRLNLEVRITTLRLFASLLQITAVLYQSSLDSRGGADTVKERDLPRISCCWICLHKNSVTFLSPLTCICLFGTLCILSKFILVECRR